MVGTAPGLAAAGAAGSAAATRRLGREASWRAAVALLEERFEALGVLVTAGAAGAITGAAVATDGAAGVGVAEASLSFSWQLLEGVCSLVFQAAHSLPPLCFALLPRLEWRRF